MKGGAFDSISLEIVVNIFTFITFRDIFYNKLTSICRELRNGVNCLVESMIQENCLKSNYLNYVNHRVTQQNRSMVILKQNIHTPIKTRLFALLDKQSEKMCFLIIHPYTNNISILLKISSDRILLIVNKQNKREIQNNDAINTTIFDRKISWNNV